MLVRLGHVRVPEDDHELVRAQIDVWVLVPPGRPVVGRQLDMVVVVVHSEGALEQRFQPVPLDAYARPADIVPTIPPPQPGDALVYLVL